MTRGSHLLVKYTSGSICEPDPPSFSPPSAVADRCRGLVPKYRLIITEYHIARRGRQVGLNLVNDADRLLQLLSVIDMRAPYLSYRVGWNGI